MIVNMYDAVEIVVIEESNKLIHELDKELKFGCISTPSHAFTSIVKDYLNKETTDPMLVPSVLERFAVNSGLIIKSYKGGTNYV